MKTIDYKFAELCDEIDFWKDQTEIWSQKYHDLLNETIKNNEQRFEETKKGVANALMFALSVKDGEDGSLVIDKESREQLANRYKEKEDQNG